MAVTYSIVIYCRYGAYEPGCRYYVMSDVVPNQAAVAQALADAQAEMTTLAVDFTRWVMLDNTGSKIDEGALTGSGLVATEFSDFKYCTYVRFNSAGPDRPSSKYIHALPETFASQGAITAGGLAALANYEAGVLAANVVDSDGFIVTGVSFRHFSRRKNVRVAA